MRRSVPPIYPHFVCFTAFLFFLTPSYGQSPRGAGQDLQNREWALGHVREEVNSHFTRETRLRPPQMRDDFRKLQMVNNDLMKRVFVLHAADAKEVKSALGEIRKLATRLKTGLAFPVPFEQAEQPAETRAFGPGLLLLDQAVMSFVRNPLFQQPKLLDASLAQQAGRDLNEILRLSELLNGLSSKETLGR